MKEHKSRKVAKEEERKRFGEIEALATRHFTDELHTQNNGNDDNRNYYATPTISRSSTHHRSMSSK